MTELESARVIIAEIHAENHQGDVSYRSIEWLCDQLSGFLNGETVKGLEAELERVKRFEDAAADERDSLRVECDRLRKQFIEAYRIDWPDRLRQAVAAERERCAKIAENHLQNGLIHVGIPAAIRRLPEEETK